MIATTIGYLYRVMPGTMTVMIYIVIHVTKYFSKKYWLIINTWRLVPNGQHLADNIFKCVFHGNHHILIQISLKFLSNGPTGNKSTLVKIIAWHQNAGLEIPDRPVANAMRNGEGLQLIPNTVARLAIIFLQHDMSKLLVFTISRDVENGQQVVDSTQIGFHFV